MPKPRKPLEHHKLASTEPSYVVPADEAATPGRPKFPKGLSPDAKRIFKKLCGILEKRRALTPGDEELMRIYATLYDRHQRALQKLAEEGEICSYTRLDSNGQPHEVEKPNLHLKIAENCEARMTSLLDRLGLTPLNRGKVVPTTPKKPKVEDPMAKLLATPASTSEDEINLDEIDEASVLQ